MSPHWTQALSRPVASLSACRSRRSVALTPSRRSIGSMSLFYSVRHGPDLRAQMGEATPGRGTALQKLLVIKLAPRARVLPLPLFTRYLEGVFSEPQLPGSS